MLKMIGHIYKCSNNKTYCVATNINNLVTPDKTIQMLLKKTGTIEFNEMMDMKMKRFHSKFLNQIPYSLTKTRIFLLSGIIFICYMLYGLYTTKYYTPKNREEGHVFPLAKLKIKKENRLLRDKRLLDHINIQPESMELLLPTRQTTIPKDAVWQTVPLNKEKFFIYSAYLDTRMESLGPVIRIIATAKTYSPTSVWCRLWYSNSSKTVSGFTYANWEHKSFKYSPSFVLCKLPPNEKNNGNYPLSVSVVSDIQDPITNEILIQIPNKTNEFKNEIEVCVQPFHNQYDQGSRIVEFVEFYHLLGVKHFTFYNYSVSPKVHCVLDQYKDDNLISVLPWNLNMSSGIEIKTEGTNAAFNDCLYRHMYTSKYIAIVDVDEMITPKSNLTLIQLVKVLDSLYLEIPEVYSYSFRNIFFCMEYNDDELSPFNQNQTDTNIIVLRKTLRHGYIFPFPDRTKYIFNPRHVIEAGNHKVSEFLDEGNNVTAIAPTEVALLHHYRHCNGLPVNCEYGSVLKPCIQKIIVDRSMFTYKNELVKKISNIRNRLHDSCVLT